MSEVIITEHAGPRTGPVARVYQYSSEGVRVLDARKNLKRLYLFSTAPDMMTERDPVHREKILKRFVFDPYGMLEETFSPGQRPRTFRYENGGRQIVVREGGQFGAAGKLFVFEQNGIVETAWGRHGEVERVYVFEGSNDLITIREGGWYGAASRTFVFGNTDAGIFHEPESFLQFLMFTEPGKEDPVSEPPTRPGAGDRVTGSGATPGRFAFTGKRRTSDEPSPEPEEDIRIDIIPEADDPRGNMPHQASEQKKSSDISFEERHAGRRS